MIYQYLSAEALKQFPQDLSVEFYKRGLESLIGMTPDFVVTVLNCEICKNMSSN